MSELETLIYKFESDNTTPTKVFCLTIIKADTGELTRYADNHRDLDCILSGVCRLSKANAVSHSVFHKKVAEKYYGLPIPRYYDTFAILREMFPTESHKLTDWAQRLHLPLSRGGANEAWSPALHNRCDAGTKVIYRLYQELTGVKR